MCDSNLFFAVLQWQLWKWYIKHARRHISKHQEQNWKYDALTEPVWLISWWLEMWSNTVLSFGFIFQIETKTKEQSGK